MGGFCSLGVGILWSWGGGLVVLGGGPMILGEPHRLRGSSRQNSLGGGGRSRIVLGGDPMVLGGGGRGGLHSWAAPIVWGGPHSLGGVSIVWGESCGLGGGGLYSLGGGGG